jgi:hypothetical protein
VVLANGEQQGMRMHDGKVTSASGKVRQQKVVRRKSDVIRCKSKAKSNKAQSNKVQEQGMRVT